MSVRAILLNGKKVKGNGGGTVVVQATQSNFEVVLGMCKLMRNEKRGGNEFSTDPPTRLTTARSSEKF
jgi:hypothetical protein